MRTVTATTIALLALCPAALCPAALAQSGQGTVVGPTHYDTVDCNAIATRQTMLREYNDRYAIRSEPRVIDVLEQRRLSATPASIACYGSYSFSDGSSRRITYREMVNSLGQTVWTFTPDT